jgi:Fic family protein
MAGGSTMELFRINQISLDGVTKELLRDVAETAHKVNDLRPLSRDVIELVQREILGERVFSSNAIEGNTYSLGETIETLKTGYVALGKKREATEVINLGKAIEHVQQNLVNLPTAHSVDPFLELHGILLRGISDDLAGQFRRKQVMIGGATQQPPDHSYVPGLLGDFFTQLNDAEPGDTNAVLIATWAHWTITRVHPFGDGNGRMSRLWQDLVLFRRRLTCAIIPPEARNEYRAALAAADEGDFNALTQLVARQVASTLDKYLTVQQKIDSLGQWAAELVGESAARATEKRRSAYLRWSRKMEELRYAFERCASLITNASIEMEVQLFAYSIIDQAAWENLRAGIGATKTWLFKLVFRRQKRLVTYIFFFGKHFWSELDTMQERSEPRVCVLINEQEGGDVEAKRLAHDVTSPLTIREIFVVDNQLVRRRFDPQRKQDVYDRGIDPTVIAQEFLQDVLLLKLP